MNLGDIIKNYRTEHGISQDVFAERSGLSKAYISILERNSNPTSKNPPIPSLETIKAVSAAICVDFNDIIALLDGDTKVSLKKEDSIQYVKNIIPIPQMKEVPLLGKIACGEPILAEENFDGKVRIPMDVDADFALTCSGDSMIGARILDGDIVFIRQQPDVDDGEIAAVLIDNEATLKRVHKQAGCLILRPENPAYAPIVITGEELNNVRILGKAVSFMSTVR